MFFWQRTIYLLVLSLFVGIGFLGVLSFPTEALAQNVQDDVFGVAEIASTTALGTGDIRSVVAQIINVFLGLLGVIAVGILVYAGYLWMTANGNEEQISRAKKMIINAVIGLAIILSSFAIAQFVIRSLSDATGVRTGTQDVDPRCLAPNPPLFCTPDEFLTCEDNHFVVSSITPSTPGPGVDPTDMNNIVVRAVFSWPLAEDTNPLDVFTVVDGDNRAIAMSAEILKGNRVVEATIDIPELCTDDDTCFDPGNYTITVSPDLRSQEQNDREARQLEIDIDDVCGEYPNVARFQVNTDSVIDTTAPTISDFAIDGRGGDPIIVPRNGFYPITALISDLTNEGETGGSGYVELRIYPEDVDPEDGKIVYKGPAVVDGSSDQYAFEYGYYVPRCRGCEPERYLVDLIAHDIDHNISTFSTSFVLVGENCDELGAPGNDADVAECLQPDGACEENWQCPSQFCLEGRCVPKPMILDIDPWDGATGNWITVFGRYFGEDQGALEFGLDSNNDGEINDEDAWIPSGLAQCQGADVWHDDWIIAEVPAGGGYALDMNTDVGNSYVRVGDNDVLDFDKTITIEAWVYPRPFRDNGAHVLRKNNSYGLFVSRTAQPWARIWQENGDLVNTVQNLTIDNETWNHLALVADAEQGTVTMYVNGEESSSVAYNGTIQIENNDLLIGTFNGTQGNWNGGLDEIKLYGRALGVDEIRTRAARGLTIDEGLVAHWAFEETDGELLSDESGNGLTGSLRGVGFSLGLLSSPYGGAFGIGDLAAVRVTRADDDTLQDSTTDDHGNRPGPRAGLFEKNDVERPGLCRVVAGETVDDLGRNITAGLPGTPIIAEGQAFGEVQLNSSELLFGGLRPAVSEWSDRYLFSAVPENILAGRVGVAVSVDGEQSNGVPFTVLGSDGDVFPVIESVDPVSTTIGSYITLFGERFGAETGEVVMAPSPEVALNCAAATPEARLQMGSCVVLDTSLPGCEGSSWQDDQVIVGIPELDSIEQDESYYLVLRTRAGLMTDGSTDTVGIIAGDPRPSICRLVPNSGPAPRADLLSVFGAHFVNADEDKDDTSMFFWSQDAETDDLSTWLSDSNSRSLDGDELFDLIEDERIDFYLPVSQADSVTMQTGPMKVAVDGVESNSVFYTVELCTEEGAQPPAEGYRCCTEGVGAGQWAAPNAACPGETNDAGYVWRFTTGKIPETLRVVEQCTIGNVVNGSSIPSPTPWYSSLPNTGWPDGNRACINADIAIRFTLPLFPNSLTDDSVRLYTCLGDSEPNCEEQIEVTDQFTRFIELNGDQGVLKLRKEDQSNLAEDTWYRIELYDTIRSQKYVQILGVDTPRNEPLQPTRPIEDTDVAYHFDFKTSSGICELTGAGMQPPSYVARDLGVLQDSRYPYDDGPNSANQPQHPLYYYLWGVGDQACRVLNVDRLGWQWGAFVEDDHDTLDDRAEADVAPGDGYQDSRGTVKAIENTFPEAIDVVASTTTVENTPPIEAVSDLIVNLGDPRVTYVEPNCLTSCTNASILAQFNRRMDVTTFQSGFRIFECVDANCVDLIEIDSDKYDLSQSTQRQLIMDWRPGSQMKPNTYYKVALNGVNGDIDDTDNIKALGRLEPAIAGTPLPAFEWRFRTKEDGRACAVSNVDIEPNPWIARTIGEKTIFSAVPYSAPNECSLRGQRLNAWSYGWDWDVADEDVATVTDFDIGNTSTSPYCDNTCVPKGSDVDRAAADTVRLCGNGRIDAGEDCDVAMDGEEPGVSCSLSCLRPGSSRRGVLEGQCGNGSVDNEFGEQCDPGNDGEGLVRSDNPYCSVDCTLRGSATADDVSEEDVQASVCGDGLVTRGESCDIANSAIGCTDQCLHTGTRMMAAWCETPDNRFVNLDGCQQSISVCGNFVIERGEECEVGVRGATVETCSSRCLLQDVCESPLRQCSSEEEGCNVDCTFSGSSLLYTTPSACGDGIRGFGEFAGFYGDNLEYQCEDTTADFGDIIPGNAPVQLVTAIGESTQIDTFGFQTTVVSSSVHDAVALFGRPVGGSADYFLQCGYSEYQTPIVQEENITYNDCPLEGGDDANKMGVAANSCCYPRMHRVESYPVDRAGLDNQSAPVCRNTFISFALNGYLDQESLANNIFIAQGHERENYNCLLDGAEALRVTDQVSATFAFSGSLYEEVTPDDGLVPWLWWHVKRLFAQVFVGDVRASEFDADDVNTWCAGMITATPDIQYEFSSDSDAVTSTISLYLDSLLDENALYAVVLTGGTSGLVDERGVGIKNPDNVQALSDSFVFQTGSEICKIREITVEPAEYSYTVPNTSATFTAFVGSTNGQQIVSIPGQYAWDWSWGPQQHQVFTIPTEDARVDRPTTTIGVGTLEGEVDALAIARVTADVDTNPITSHIGRSFAGPTHLRAAFCEHPWPAGEGEQQGFVDEQYNFRFHYCADSGLGGVKEDDLPFFDVFTFTEDTRQQDFSVRRCSEREENDDRTCTSDDDCDGDTNICETVIERRDVSQDILPQSTLKRYLMFNEQNDDAIGVQIFRNQDRLDPRSWYASQEGLDGRFDNIAQFRDTEIANYPAITDGSNYYIHALNKIDEPIAACGNTTVCSNIYHFSINDTAQDSSKNAFEQIIDTLTFNVNLTDYQYCGTTDTDLPDYAFVNTPCDHDYDCQPLEKDILTTPPQSGRCSIGFEIQSPVEVAGFAEDIDFVDENNGWIVGSAGIVLYTFDQGISWEEQDSGVDVDLYAVDFVSDQVGFAVGAEGTVIKTVDSGANWELIAETGTEQRLRAVHFPTPQVGYAGGDDGIFLKTTDGGVTWTPQILSYNELQLRHIADLWFIGDNRGFIVTAKGQLLFTADGGDTWEQKVYQEGFFSDIFFVDNSIGFAIGGGTGLWRTLDGGTTWSEIEFSFGGNTTLRTVGARQLSFISPREGWIATTGGKVYRTETGGLTWTEVVDIASPLRSMYMLPSSVGFTAGLNFEVATIFAQENVCASTEECVGTSVCQNAVSGETQTYRAPDCKADRTEFLHDWRVQLPAIASIQQSLEGYVSQNNVYPALESGTFIPNYTNSRWPSWNQTFSQTLGTGVPRDSVNDWSTCGYCEGDDLAFCTEDSDCPQVNGQSGTCRILDSQTCWDPEIFTYVCPAHSSVFEYAYNRNAGDYTLHTSLSYFDLTDPVVQEFIDPSIVSLTPYCEPDEIISPFSERCGDGVVNTSINPDTGEPYEQCDPPGSVSVSTQGYYAEQVGQCDFPNMEQQCGVDGDCVTTFLRYQTGTYSVLHAPADQVCAWDGSIIHGDIDRKRLETWSCTSDDDCRNAATYGIGTLIRALDNRFRDGEVVTEDNVQNQIFSCERVDDLQNFNDNTATVSCEGSRDSGFQQCEQGGVATARCNDQCQYEYGSCQSLFVCGNAVVEGDEVCDDGVALNGTFGHCNERCSGRFAAFCGNGQRDWFAADDPNVRDPNDNKYRDPDEVGQEFCEINNFVSTGFCEDLRTQQCGDDSECGVCASNRELSCADCPQEEFTCDPAPGTCRVSYQGDTDDSSCQVFGDCYQLKRMTNNQISYGWLEPLLEPARNFYADGQSVCVTDYSGVEEIVLQRTPDSESLGPNTSIIFGFGCEEDTACQRRDTYASRGDAGENTRIGFLRTDLETERSTAVSYAVGDARFAEEVLQHATCKPLRDVEWLWDGAFSITSNWCNEAGFNICSHDNTQQCDTVNDCSLCVDGACLANNTSQYHIERELSCAWDCQSIGGYCGDGTVQLEFEECDGGNGCTDVCTLTSEAREEQQESEDPDQPMCGDGIWQEDYDDDGQVDEVCDQGDQNGIACTPTYGESCSYCSHDCEEVLTVDPVSFCGDNRIDQENEVCEVFGQSQIVEYDDQNRDGYSELLCEDKGEYSCNPTCSELTDTCVRCQLLREPQGAEPRLAVLNPAASYFDEGEFTWNKTMRVQLFRAHPNTQSHAWGAASADDLTRFVDEQQPLLANDGTLESNHLCKEEYYVAFNTVGRCTGSIYNPFNRCQSDDDCQGESTCLLGYDYNLHDNQEGDAYPVGVSQTITQTQQPFFTYPVDSEPTTINREILASPALPEGTYRFVLRWDDALQEREPRIGLSVYNLGFSDDQKQLGYHQFAPDDMAPWSNQLELVDPNRQELPYSGYWWTRHVESRQQQRSVFVHGPHGLDDTFVQSITIDTNNHWGTGGLCSNTGFPCNQPSDCNSFNGPGACNLFNPIDDSLKSFAIYALSMDGPITEFEEDNIFVDVYTYKEGQDPTFSILTPFATYSIKSATKSTNPRARYWHVANVVKIDTTSDGVGDSYALQEPIEAFPDVNDVDNDGDREEFILTEHPQGAIESGFQDIRCNTPEEREICRR